MSAPAGTTIVAIARRHAHEIPDRPAYVFLPDGQTEAARYDFARVDLRARAVAAALRERGLAGERVLVGYPSGLPYVEGFLGCLYAGAIAVPVDSPVAESSRHRLRAIVADCAPAALLTGVPVDGVPELLGLPTLDVAAVPDSAADGWPDRLPDPDALAFLQYTSGSTRTPRGVMVSHRNIVANERLIAAACRHDEGSTFVGWQPLFHDMGLVANLMQPLYLGALSVLMPPMAFLQRPLRWLAAIGRYRAHTSGGPNFAYDMCVAAATADACAGLDLASWRVAFNSAEPVRAATMDRFTETFARYGFRAAAHFPCYGLAEATLLVTGPGRDEPATVLAADPAALRGGTVRAAAPGTSGVPLVSSGTPGVGAQLRIADPVTGLPCPQDTVGEIWVAGDPVAGGYWAAPEESSATFGATLPDAPGLRFLRTGDLGCLRDGRLYVTGRAKDMLVVRGQNHYPQDIERAAEDAYEGLRPGAAAAIPIDVAGAERLVLCCELRSYKDRPPVPVLAERIRAALLRREGIDLHALVVLRRGGVPRTTSGKVRRRACRDGYLAGTLPVYGQAVLAATGAPLPALGDLRALGPAAGARRLAEALLDLVAARPDAGQPVAGRADPGRSLAELGVNSVGALAVHHALRQGYGVDLGLAGVLAAASVTELAARVLDAAPVDTAPVDTAPVDTAPVDDAQSIVDNGSPAGEWLPLTERQRALWYEQRLAPQSAGYHLARALAVRGVPAARWTAAVDRLVRAHPGLRTAFEERDGEPGCRVLPSGPALRHADATALTEAEFAAVLREEADRPFPLPGGAPVRLTVWQRDGGTSVLHLVAHHLVADFWSLGVLLRELAAHLRSAEPVGPADPGPAAVLATQQRYAGSADRDRDAAYWRDHLAAVPDVLDLPTDGPPPPVRGFAGAGLAFRIGARLTARLRALAAARGCTLFTVLLAGYQLLLHRYAGRDDLVVGTLLAGRDDPDLAGLVGYLVDVVPVRSRTRAGQPFTEFLAGTGRAIRGALAHGRYPFHRIVADLDPARTPGRAPLVQSLFAMHREHGDGGDGLRALALGIPGTLELDGLRAEVVPAPRRWAQFDLSLHLAEVGTGLAGVWEYRTDLFAEPTVAAMAAALTRLLEAIADRPGAPADRLSTVDRATRERLLAHAGGPVVPRPDGTGLHHLVAGAARRHPGSVAVVAPADPDSGGDATHLTYRALDRAARRVAGGLRARGIHPDQPVAVLARRGLDLVVAYLGVLYAGAAVFPLDPDDPDARLAGVLADAGAPLVLSGPGLAERATRLPVPALAIGEVAGAPAEPARVHPAQAAYLLYTSGSTGVPKGVLVPHAAIVNRIRWMQEEYRLRPAERVLHKTPVTFDVSLWELFWPLAEGGCLVLAAPARHRDPRYLLDVLARERVSTVHFVPTVLAPVLAEAARPGAPVPAPRRVVCSGEALPARLATAAAQRFGAQVHNLYGPTEAAVDVTAWHHVPGDPGPVPIGRPIANVSCRVLDRHGVPVPPRATGELVLAGRCLARGYLNRPGLTAARFVPLADAGPGARGYRTGDLARIRPDGALEFLGRGDHQVKLGGNRVELGEVAEALRRRPGVVDAVAVVAGDSPALVAYVVTPAGSTVDGLRAELAEQLPGYMVPTAIVAVDRFPVTASGKLDRAALPDPVPAPGAAGAPADTATERRLAELWRAHLGRPVGVDQDFYAAGGDSMMALRLVGAARDAGMPVTVTDLLRHRTIRAVAGLLDRGGSTVDDGEPEPFALYPPAAGRPGVVDAYPISMAQRSILHQQSVHPGYEVYLTSLEAHVPLRREALAAAVAGAVARHPYLRSRFDLAAAGGPVQLVHAELPPALEVVDLRELPGPERERAVRGWLAAERRRRFDTGTGPLVRFAAHDLGGSFRLTVSSFGLDGWCDATLLTELLSDYAGRLRGAPPRLAAPRTTYRAFVAAELAAIDSPAHRRFWRDELAGARPTRLPRDCRPGAGDATVRRYLVPLPSAVEDGMVDRARSLGVSVKHVLLAAHVQVLAAATGRAEVVTGLQMNGRPERADGDRVIGMFNNIVPLRLRLAGLDRLALVHAVARAEARLTPYRRYPLVEAQRRYGAAKLFDTLFVYTHFHAYQRLSTMDDIRVSGLYAPDQTYLPLTAHGNVDAWSGRPRLLLEFDPREFTEDRVREIGGDYADALAGFVADPHGAVGLSAAPAGGGAVDPPDALTGDALAGLVERLRGLTEEETAALLARRAGAEVGGHGA